MRLIPILVLSFALVLAGCAKKDDGGTATSTPPTTSGTTTKTTTTSTPVTTTPSSNNSTTTPTKPAPQELAKGNFDFSNPATPPAAKAFTIPAGYTMGNLTVTWTCVGGAPACVTNAVSIKAAGLVCNLPAGPVDPAAAASKCVKEGAVTAGDGKVEAGDTGPGAVTGAFTFTVS